MPTWEATEAFLREYRALRPEQRKAFRAAQKLMTEDLRAKKPFRPSLRIKRVQGTHDVWEMTWAPDGRATFHFGREQRSGEAHIIWRRIGPHSIFRRP